MKRFLSVLVVFLLGAVFGYFLLCDSVSVRRGNIAVVEIEGGLYSSSSIVDQLEELGKLSNIKGVVLRIDSPGGLIAPSQELYRAVVRLRGKKKVVASLGSVAASGGYYVACGAGKIVANEGTITGSIGVRMDHVNLEELISWMKIKKRVLVSGRFKDIGSPLRELTAEEEEILTSVLEQMHDQFKKVVATERKLSSDEMERIADGRIFTGEEAYRLKLVDSIGSLHDAIDIVRGLAGIEGEPDVIYPKARSGGWLHSLIEEIVGAAIDSVKSSKGNPALLWHM